MSLNDAQLLNLRQNVANSSFNLGVETLTILFCNQQHDLRFVSKFRKISKKCCQISEYWLTSVNMTTFPKNVNVTKFKNLQRLVCNTRITNKDLQSLPHLKYLTVDHLPRGITDEGIQHLKLISLDMCRNTVITNNGIKFMNLYSLDVRYTRIYESDENNSVGFYRFKTTDEGYYIYKITNEGIKHMTNLKKLYINPYCGITGEGIKHLHLETLQVDYPDYHYDDTSPVDIRDEHVFNMQSLKFLSVSETNITDKGIENLINLTYLDISMTKVTDKGLRNLVNLQILMARACRYITNEGLKHLNLKKLCSTGNNNISEEGIKHMTNCQMRDSYW